MFERKVVEYLDLKNVKVHIQISNVHDNINNIIIMTLLNALL